MSKDCKFKQGKEGKEPCRKARKGNKEKSRRNKVPYYSPVECDNATATMQIVATAAKM
jgi:hypothetical protein